MATTEYTLDQALEKIRKLAQQAGGRRRLQFYWDVGTTALRTAGGYGSNTRATIAAKLEQDGIEGLQKENLAKAAKFAATFDRSGAVKLEELGVGWRAAAMLCSSYVDRVRDVLVQSLESGQITPAELGGKIRKMSGEKAVANTRSVLAAAGRATKEIKAVIRIAYSPRVDDELKETAHAALEKLRRLLDERLA